MSDVLSNNLADRMVRATARQVSRRRFLRNSGGAALGVAVGSALVGTGLSRPGAAVAHGPCGPSPHCPSGRCFNGQCSNAAGRAWGSTRCLPGQLGGCWNAGGQRCCDCCAFNGGGARCGSCGDGRARFACHCQRAI